MAAERDYLLHFQRKIISTCVQESRLDELLDELKKTESLSFPTLDSAGFTVESDRKRFEGFSDDTDVWIRGVLRSSDKPRGRSDRKAPAASRPGLLAPIQMKPIQTLLLRQIQIQIQ